MSNRETKSRRNLPHWYRPGAAHFLTYRLKDSIPVAKLREWRERRDRDKQRPENRSSAKREVLHKKFFAEYDRYLDRNPGKSWLVDPSIAEMIRENLYYHHDSLYDLIAIAIMSNHVHSLLQPKGDSFGCRPDTYEGGDEIIDGLSPLSKICHSLKSYTAHEANKILGRSGGFWQKESYDHWVRDDIELERIMTYIDRNAVNAGICQQPHEYRWSSAYDLFQRTGRAAGALWLPD